MNRKKILSLSSYFLILILLSGCATMPESRSYNEESAADRSLDVSSILRFDDMPVPSGFKILDSESFVFQNSVTRVALLKYIGARNADHVVRFYKQ